MQFDRMDFSVLGRWLRPAILCSPLLLCLACSSASSSTGSNPITNPPPVSAQTTYSNASLSGTYSISTGIPPGTGGGTVLIPTVGTLQFDGNGNITGGSIQYLVPGLAPSQTRQYSIAGTYSVSSSASGTATLTFKFTGGNTNQGFLPFIPSTPLTFTLQAAQQGASVVLAENDAVASFSIVALKQ